MRRCTSPSTSTVWIRPSRRRWRTWRREWAGFTIDEVMRLLQCVRGKNIIGGDVVCLMPTKDSPNKITAHVASVLMFEILSLTADALTS